MTTKEMKQILANKLRDEGTYFQLSDISIRKQGESYRIVIKDYEHIPFRMSFAYDDYFGFEVWIHDLYENCNIVYCDDTKKYDIEHALLQLGYYIGNCF